MRRKRHTVEQSIGKLREAEVLLSPGRTTLGHPSGTLAALFPMPLGKASVKYKEMVVGAVLREPFSAQFPV